MSFFFVPVGGVFPVKVFKRSFSHFSTWWPQTDGPTNWRTDKASYRIACLQLKKQGRIHGYLSRVRVGRGRIWGHFIIMGGALRPETAKNRNKFSVTDRKAGCRVAWNATKSLEMIKLIKWVRQVLPGSLLHAVIQGVLHGAIYNRSASNYLRHAAQLYQIFYSCTFELIFSTL